MTPQGSPQKTVASRASTAPPGSGFPGAAVGRPRQGGKNSAWRLFFRRPSTMVFLPVVLIFVLIALIGPFFAGDPIATSFPKLLPPGGGHLLGTDMLGRDYLARVVYGGQISLLVGFGVAVLCLTLGLIVGGLAGYYGGWVDTGMVKIAEFFQALPGLVLALVAAAVLGSSLFVVGAILAITMWPAVGRIVRAEAMRISKLGYVESQRAAGFRGLRILCSDVIPNAMPPVLVATTMTVGRAILIESGLAYIGIGDPGHPSWGSLLNDAQSHIRDSWWLAVVPGFCIFLVVLAVNMLGDALNDAFNPTIGRVK